jgi:tetratricopeptide (TPR) repeat protein
MNREQNQTSERRERRWTVPHAITRGPGETLDYLRVLDEHDAAFGILLWSLVRNVELWAETQPELRPRIFAPAAADVRMRRLLECELPDEIAGALDTLSAILSVPEYADAEVVTACCTRVAGWARTAGTRETAVAFAQAAALASPEDGVPALLTGGCALELGQQDRAESWLRRALGLARRAGQRQVYAASLVLLGEMEAGRGNGVRARRTFRTAFLAARRWGFAAERARSAYGLFRLAAAEGRRDEAARFASLAEHAARRVRDGSVTLGDDLSRFWLEAGEPRRALALLRRSRVECRAPEPRPHPGSQDSPPLAQNSLGEG